MVPQTLLWMAAAFALAAAQDDFYSDGVSEGLVFAEPYGNFLDEEAQSGELTFDSDQAFGGDFEDDYESYPIYDDEIADFGAEDESSEMLLGADTAEASPVIGFVDSAELGATDLAARAEMPKTMEAATATDEWLFAAAVSTDEWLMEAAVSTDDWLMEAAVSTADLATEPMQTAEV